jgi:glycosyltransferase involved in cell wall biosynthesis
MNILFFTQLFYPSLYGGGEYLFFLIAKELVKRGYGVHVIAQRLSGTEVFEQVEGINIHRVGSEITYSGTLPPTIRANLNYLTSAVKKGREIIKESRNSSIKSIDIIHSNTYIPAVSGYLCSKLYSLPHVISFYDVYQASDTKFWKNWTATQQSNVPFYASSISRIIERIVLKLNPAVFHTISKRSKEDLVDFGVKSDKIMVIPPAIESSRYQYNKGSETSSIASIQHNNNAVFVGRLVFYKNVQTVIRAFRKVIAIVPDAKMIIIGDGPFKKQLLKEAEPIKENVIFTERVSHECKVKWIAESSFMVFPSLIEGFGIAIIESFACKKPVLVSDIRPMSDIVKDNHSGFLISPFDEEEWANKMIYLFRNFEQRERMGENAHQEIQSKYEIDAVIPLYQNLYQSLVNYPRDFIAAAADTSEVIK